MASGYTDDNGRLNPLLQPGDGKNYQAWPVGSSDPGGPPEVIWVEPAEIVDVTNELSKQGLPTTAGNVRAALARMRDKYPVVYRPNEGAFIRDNQLQFGPAKAKPPQAGVGGWGPLGYTDPLFAGGGNAFMRGSHSVLGAYEGWRMQGALRDKLALASALEGKAGEMEVTDAVNEAAKAGLPMPTSDQEPAAILADLVGQGMRQTTQPSMGSSYGFYSPNGYVESLTNARQDPRYIDAVKAQSDAQGFVDSRLKFQDEINAHQRRRETGVSLFKNPPSSAQYIAVGDGGYDLPDQRVAGDFAMSKVAEYVLSLTPEQRASMTDGQIRAKVDQILSGEVEQNLRTAANSVGQRDASMRYWSPTSDALKTYNKNGENYDSVYDQHGATGVFNTMFQQLSESTPNTAATMAATALVTSVAPELGPAAMGLSTAVLTAGTNFNQAFGAWLGSQGIDLTDLEDPNRKSFNTEQERIDAVKKFETAQAKLNSIAAQDPAMFMGQIDAMLKESTQRGVAEGVTAVALNKVGDVLTERIKGMLPKSFHAPRTSGSLLRPVPAMIARPVETFRGGIFKKILIPRAINGSIDTWWEATEEGLTDIITSTVMGDDVDLKQALASFMVGGLMGGTSSFGFGRSNIDNPLQIIQEKAAEGEPGLDQVAAEIEKNTGMPAARAKAAIQKAGEIIEQFETFAKRYPPSMRGYAWRYFIQGYKGNKDDIMSHEQDIRRATIKDKQNALAALQEALDRERLMAVRPGNVPVSPLIPSLQGDIDRLRQGFDYTKGEGRYYHPLDRSYGGER